MYSKSMLNTANRLLNNTGDAEDAMQEGFLSAFTSLNKYNNSVSFGTWLKRIVINKSLDIYRKKRKLLFTDELDKTGGNETEYSPEIFENPDYRSELINLIHNTLYVLPDGYRIVFTLNLIEGYDHDEISGILSITPSSSRSQLARAKKMMIKHLNESSIFDKYKSCYGKIY